MTGAPSSFKIVAFRPVAPMSIANVRSGFSSMPFALFGDLGDFAVSFASFYPSSFLLPELLVGFSFSTTDAPISPPS